MPYTSILVSEGTISWPIPLESANSRYVHGRRSNVLRASSVFLSMYNPEEMVKFGWDPDIIDYTSTYLERFKTIKKELLEKFRVIQYYPCDKLARECKRDFVAKVSSMEKERLSYFVNAGNLPYPVPKWKATDEDVFNEFLSFLNYEGRCTCGAVTKKGNNCSMPQDYYSRWFEAATEEYDRILYQPDEPKPYGNLICKHQMKALVEDGRFPHLFDKMKFYSLFPEMLKSLRTIDKNSNLTITDLDKALLPLIKKMSLNTIHEYLMERSSLDKRIEETRRSVINRLSKFYAV
ncbi:MAG: hypothetical protein ABIA12_02245 [Candidatus Aenigmatarchaeota archaeon]